MTEQDKYGNKIEYYLLPRQSFDAVCQKAGATERKYDDGFAALYAASTKAFVYVEGDVVEITGRHSSVKAAVIERTQHFVELL